MSFLRAVLILLLATFASADYKMTIFAGRPAGYPGYFGCGMRYTLTGKGGVCNYIEGPMNGNTPSNIPVNDSFGEYPGECSVITFTNVCWSAVGSGDYPLDSWWQNYQLQLNATIVANALVIDHVTSHREDGKGWSKSSQKVLAPGACFNETCMNGDCSLQSDPDYQWQLCYTGPASEAPVALEPKPILPLRVPRADTHGPKSTLVV